MRLFSFNDAAVRSPATTGALLEFTTVTATTELDCTPLPSVTLNFTCVWPVLFKVAYRWAVRWAVPGEPGRSPEACNELDCNKLPFAPGTSTVVRVTEG